MWKSILLLILSLIVYSCSEDHPAPGLSDNVYAIRVFDVGNNHNASDIRVDFLVENEKGISEYRIIVVKNDQRELSVGELEQLPTTAYNSFVPVAAAKSIVLKENQRDRDGEVIVINQEYVVVIYTPENKRLSGPSLPFQLKDQSLLVGEFRGLWNDNLYTDFAISAVLTASGSSIRGSFYYDGNFISCCGGSDDGEISFRLNDTSIENFVYNQDLVNFMGGWPGLYSGSGELLDDFTIFVNFAGEDCEGPHTNGTIRLTKRF